MSDAIARMVFFLLQNDAKIIIDGRREKEYKFCNRCKITRPVSDFSLEPDGQYKSKCRFCRKIIEQKYRKKKHTQERKLNE